MISDLENARVLAGLVGILVVAGPLLWMANSMATADPERFMRVGVAVIVEMAVPAFGLIAFFYAVIKFASLVGEMQV